jgi:hypothetical protein
MKQQTNRITKRELCTMYSITYKTLRKRLAPLAKKLDLKKRKFGGTDLDLVLDALGDPE